MSGHDDRGAAHPLLDLCRLLKTQTFIANRTTKRARKAGADSATGLQHVIDVAEELLESLRSVAIGALAALAVTVVMRSGSQGQLSVNSRETS